MIVVRSFFQQNCISFDFVIRLNYRVIFIVVGRIMPFTEESTIGSTRPKLAAIARFANTLFVSRSIKLAFRFLVAAENVSTFLRTLVAISDHFNSATALLSAAPAKAREKREARKGNSSNSFAVNTIFIERD